MSYNSIPILTLTRTAGGTIAAHRFVTPLAAQAGADANTLGVSRIAAVSGDKIMVDVLGTAVVEAGAAVADGASLKADASGRAITWATAGAKVAIALEAASAAGQFIEVALVPNIA